MKKLLFIIAAFAFFLNAKSQDSEFTKEFINKNHTALNKAQKELMKSQDPIQIKAFKDAVILQMASVKSYKSNNLKQSYNMAYKSRTTCLDLLTKLNPSSASYFNLTDTEKNVIGQDAEKSISVEKSLSKEEINKVENMDVLSPVSLRELEINLN